jgi:hypothetical protein
MHDSYVLYGITAGGCVAKVVDASREEGAWLPVSPEVYCLLYWLDVDSSLHAYVQVQHATAALERALARLLPGSTLQRELTDVHRRVMALGRSPPLGWCGRIIERVRAGPRTALERLALSAAGLG